MLLIKTLRGFRRGFCFFAAAFTLIAAYADQTAPALSPREQAELAAKKIKVPPGFNIELFASEPLLQNPVAFALDEKGNCYVAETFRLHTGVIDIRHHMNFLDEELASQSIEDQLANIKRHQAELPNMHSHSDRVSFIQDTDGDGKLDKSTIFAGGFTNTLDGLGSGVLARKGDVYYTCIPSLYLLRDNDGDGMADVRNELQTGYGVRFGFIGHDLHGLCIGPDGRLYFSIGDRGFHVKQGDRPAFFPEGGAVLRCNLDGSDLEIFHYGLRNPQELAFDDYGNLFTGDNNSDAGDQARWVHLVEGGDSGWRIGWQFINHPVGRGPWNYEKMWHPQNDEQPAYILPPLANIGAGPSGLTHYSGVGLPTNYLNQFFMCDFRGAAANSLVHSIALKPRGASFEVSERKDFISEVLVTDVQMGNDGAIYIADWVEGWDMPGKGRIYKISHTESAKDPLVAETKKIIAEGMDNRTSEALAKFLEHRDQRVRLEAQLALAEKGDKAVKLLAKVTQKNTNQLARIHAAWGLGQILSSKKVSSSVKNSAGDALVPLLGDKDAEIRAQAAKVLGDGAYAKAYKPLLRLLEDVDEPRGQFFAALALGKIGKKDAVKPLLEMLRANNDEDVYVRHAGVMALVRLTDFETIKRAAQDNSPAVRLAVAIAMRRLQHADVATLLDDKQQNVVLEAARAINDLPIVQALPALAALIERPNYDEPLFRRVLNANYRVGESANAVALAKFAAMKDAPGVLRVEALDMLNDWAKPSGRDRITGLWRPVIERDPKAAADAARPFVNDLVKSGPNEVRLAALQLAEKYKLKEGSSAAFEIFSTKETEVSARVAALSFLAAINHSKLAEAVEIAGNDKDEKLRNEAVALQAKLKPSDATGTLITALENGTVSEKQNALKTLGTMKDESAEKLISEWLDKLIAGQAPPEVQLELLDAAGKRETGEIKTKLEKYETSRPKDDLAAYRECLAGGNADDGKKIFFERVEVSCVRCHKIKGEGADIGPPLDGLASRVSRDYILKSLVNPNAEIAAGFETVIVKLKNGSAYAGTLKGEDAKELKINSPEDGLITVKKSDVEKRESGVSGMPPDLAKLLSKHELRDLIEFLASQK